MNATAAKVVTKSNKKNILSRKASETVSATSLPPKVASSAKQSKPMARALTSRSKATRINVREALATSVKTVVEPTGKTAARLARAGKSATSGNRTETFLERNNKISEASAAVKQAARAAAKNTSLIDQKKAKKPSAQTNSQAAEFGTHMSTDNAAAIFVDNIQTSVASKVSEVATKTTKPTPDIPADGTLLTEEQVLKMSDKDYMNAAQLAFFKARLQQLEKELLKNAGETTEHLRETVLVPDPADRATIEEEHALELRTRDRERKLLKKVQQSIASIDSGEYGWCEETGEPIGIPRLLARPTATLSLEAQQRRELKQKLYGD